MSNYIVKYNDITQHYFYIPNQGLCVRSKSHSIWQNHKPVYRDCNGVFSVFTDPNGALHAICTNPQNELIYLSHRHGTWQSCAITRLKEDMKVLDINIFETQIGLNLLYTAVYLGETLLIHCVLGDNALPDTLDRLSSPEFFFFRGRVYYTNTSGVLGYRDISDGKADNFNRLVPGGTMPYLYTRQGTDMIVYKKGSGIYFQNRPVIDDEYAKNPILAGNHNQLLLMWQNGDFVRYIVSTDGGTKWSGIMQYVNSGKSAQIYNVINNSRLYLYFGTHSGTDLHIYGKNDIFEPDPEPHQAAQSISDSIADPNMVTRLKIMIEMQKKEIADLKKQIELSGQAHPDAHDIADKNNAQKDDTTV